MDLFFVPPSLRRLDSLQSDALAMSFFEDERPFRGTLGFVDWRLCGFLSKQRFSERIAGQLGEVTLIPSQGRLTFEKLFVFGLGYRDDFDDSVFARVVEHTLEILTQTQIRSAVLSLPGRSQNVLEPEKAIDILIPKLVGIDALDELILIEDTEAQRAMERVMQQARRRARAVTNDP